MVNYDSDSSGGEDGDYTKTNVVLGYCSEKPFDPFNQLGGNPQWLDPASPPSAALARCKVCQDMMVLLLQLNGDLPEEFADHERKIYIMACRRHACRRKEGSVRALRGIKATKASKNPSVSREKDTNEVAGKVRTEDRKVVASTGLGEGLFGVKPTTTTGTANANPFSSTLGSNPFSSSSSSPSVPSNPFATTTQLAAKPAQQPTSLPQTFASVLSLNTPPPTSQSQTFGPVPPPTPWPPASDLPPSYPHYYLEDGIETLDAEPSTVPVPTQTMDLDDEGAGGSGSQKEDKDAYESTIDKAFQKFADRLAQNPEQVLRYEFRGQPLLYSKSDAVGRLLAGDAGGHAHVKVGSASGGAAGIPRCANCGAPRVFEMQLMPHAIMELEAEEMGMEGMEWGTIVVGVCGVDCVARGSAVGEVGYVEEWVGVQWEEEMKR